MAHRIHRRRGRALGSAGGPNGHTYPLFAEGALKRRSLYALNAEVQNMGHRVGRAVEANGGILAQLGAQALIQPAYMAMRWACCPSASRSAVSADTAMPNAGVPLR